jgi:hypothetical protein
MRSIYFVFLICLIGFKSPEAKHQLNLSFGWCESKIGFKRTQDLLDSLESRMKDSVQINLVCIDSRERSFQQINQAKIDGDFASFQRDLKTFPNVIRVDVPWMMASIGIYTLKKNSHKTLQKMIVIARQGDGGALFFIKNGLLKKDQVHWISQDFPISFELVLKGRADAVIASDILFSIANQDTRFKDLFKSIYSTQGFGAYLHLHRSKKYLQNDLNRVMKEMSKNGLTNRIMFGI